MEYTSKYPSPLGEILLAADDEGLIGLWFFGQKYFAKNLDKNNREKETEILAKAKKWLNIYFSGKEPNFEIPLHFKGTDFQQKVWKILCTVPYGKTITYGEIAKILARENSLKKMSAQAVGGAVGRNNISIIVPCHRVLGSGGKLVGYAAGMEKKLALLKIEASSASQ